MNNEELFDGIKSLNYPGIQTSGEFKVIVNGGLKNDKFTQLVAWLCKELKVLLKLDEDVTSTQDSSSLLLELSSFLKELGCPYKSLIEGHVNSRLRSPETCTLLLDYLISEVSAARMYRTNFPDSKKEMSITINETSTAKNLRDMLMALKFNKPPENISAEQLFGRVLVKVSEILKSAPPSLVGKQMFNGELSPKQWDTIKQAQTEMAAEYKLRREMLLTRLDCTIESFKWSDRLKGKESVIEKVYSEKREKLSPEPSVGLADLLAARDDLAITEKTSNSSVRRNTSSGINKVIIGRVPDRGGRPSEQQPPPPEMPSWQQRNAGGGGRGGGGGGSQFGFSSGRGGASGRGYGGDQKRDSGFTPGGGARVSAGWNPGSNYQVTVGYQQDNRGGGYQGQNNRNGSGGGYSQHDNRGYQQHDNRGSYQQNDNRGGYQQDRNRDGGDRGGRDYHNSRGGRGSRGRGGWY